MSHLLTFLNTISLQAKDLEVRNTKINRWRECLLFGQCEGQSHKGMDGFSRTKSICHNSIPFYRKVNMNSRDRLKAKLELRLQNMSASPSPSPAPSDSTVVTCDTALSVNTEATEATEVTTNAPASSSGSGSGAGSTANSETRSFSGRFSPPSWRGLMEVWQAGDVLPTGEVIRCSPFRAQSIDAEKGLLVEGEEKEGGRVVPIGRSRKVPRKDPLPIYLERHSRVEVWAKSPKDYLRQSGAWYLAEVRAVRVFPIQKATS